MSSNPSEILDIELKRTAYREQMEGLLAGGVDVFFLETFSKAGELVLALEVAKSLANLPVIASLSFSDDGHTADGFRINQAFQRLRDSGADVVGVNCHAGPLGVERLLTELEVRAGDLISAFPNAGRPEFFLGRYIYHPTSQYFADFVPKLVAQGARLIGGCCGTDPGTIAAMAPVLRALKPVTAKQVVAATKVEPVMHSAPPREINLLDLARDRTLIVTELDPPKSLSLEKMIEGSRALKAAGTDFVTMADNSLAILRVSNLASALLVKQQAAIEPIIHLTCRDRNLRPQQNLRTGFGRMGS